MFSNTALDVFIGLTFIFLLYSLLATIIQEMIATRFGFRAKVLEKAILRMLEDGKTSTRLPYGDRISGILHIFGLKNLLKGKTIAPWFYAHPLIKYLGEDNYYSKPAYLDASNFSKVMLDLLKGFGQPESQAVQSIHNSVTAGIIHKLPINISAVDSDKANPAIKILRAQNPGLSNPPAIASETVQLNPNTALFLRSIWQDSGADMNTFKLKLEDWFNDTMERATGWYKKYTRIVLFVIGLIVAYVFNVDTIAIHRILSTNKSAREQMVQMAISSRVSLDPNKILQNNSSNPSNPQSDSLLNATYKMVANDASKANDILGLGRPWRDSCIICDSFFGCKEKKVNTDARLESLRTEKRIYDSLNNLLKNNQVVKDSVVIFISRTKDSAELRPLNIRLTAVQSTIKDLQAKLEKHSGLNEELKSLTVLSVRCPYIKEEKKKWFKYSPNQAGGFETILGWLITAMAVTLGAPFWFDLLSKLISLRGSGSKISSTDDNNNNNKKNTPPNATPNPVTVNVNPNPGEEAVG